MMYTINARQIKEIAEQLKNMMDDSIPTWFAIHDSAEDQEDGFGSNDPQEAAQMAIDGNAYSIALVYDNGTDEQYNELVIE